MIRCKKYECRCDEMDYSKYKSSGRYYTGAERKKGILIQGEPYIVKYAKNSPQGITYSYVSEYIGSHLFQLAGMEAQQTFLGTCDGSPVVVMKDFIGENERFVPFNDIGDSTLEQSRERYQYTYDDIMQMLEDNMKLTNVEETIHHFWDMYLMDAWIGNFDRHGSNWGFLKKNNQYRMAPVYDNGSSLFPRLNTEEKLQKVLDSEEEMLKRVYTFPTSQILLCGKKSSYYELIDSLQYKECNEALMRIIPKIDLEKMEKLIDEIEEISTIRKIFYKRMLHLRYDIMIKEPYQKLIGRSM